MRVLFVCLGNICRSPLAEGVFRHLVAQAGLSDRIEVDSAGTGGWHVGEPPDPRSVQVAHAHGIDLSTQRARRLGAEDLQTFDEVLAMDASNLAQIQRLVGPHARARVGLLLDEAPGLRLREVPDPYYGGPRGFEECYALVHAGCSGLLERLRRGL